VFKGTYRHKIDSKGRLPVPAPLRRLLPQGEAQVVLTVLDQCLAVYPPGAWSELESELRALPAFSKPVKALTRLLASRAADATLDVQGRILLPPALRLAAGLEREAVVIGALNRFEVWAPATWESFLRESERLLDDAAIDLGWPPSSPAPPRGLPVPLRPQEKPKR
jgi:transcriptional regulator MraZ